jgi:hypothetical protein
VLQLWCVRGATQDKPSEMMAFSLPISALGVILLRINTFILLIDNPDI